MYIVIYRTDTSASHNLLPATMQRHDDKIEGKDIYEPENAILHECKLCNRKLKQKLSAGYTNLRGHAESRDGWKASVRDYLQAKVNGGAMDAHVRPVSEKAKSLYRWIEWIVVECLPFNIVKRPMYRKHSNLKKTSLNTLKK